MKRLKILSGPRYSPMQMVQFASNVGLGFCKQAARARHSLLCPELTVTMISSNWARLPVFPPKQCRNSGERFPSHGGVSMGPCPQSDLLLPAHPSHGLCRGIQPDPACSSSSKAGGWKGHPSPPTAEPSALFQPKRILRSVKNNKN